MENGYILYAKFQMRETGDFFTHLFRAIQSADPKNLARLGIAFPGCVDAYKTFTRVGADKFFENAPDDPIIALFKERY